MKIFLRNHKPNISTFTEKIQNNGMKFRKLNVLFFSKKRRR